MTTDVEALRAAAEDVRRSHQPNEWDSCVACRHQWPCDAEMLAELVMTRAALSPGPEPVAGDVEAQARFLASTSTPREAIAALSPGPEPKYGGANCPIGYCRATEICPHPGSEPVAGLDVALVTETFRLMREEDDLPDSSASDEFVAETFIERYAALGEKP